MPHFFIKSTSVKEKNIIINDESNYQHIVKSLRANIGERLLLIDENEIEYVTLIKEITKDSIVVEINESHKSKRKLSYKLYLAQSPLRSDAQVTVIEKATELGISGVYPIYTDNCALKKSVIETKISKWQNVMYAASKQCERANIPVCYPLSTLAEVIESEKFDKVIALCERNTSESLKSYLSKNFINIDEKILVIIGPEGGFSDNEFKYFKNNKIPMLSLGNLILKAETAVIVTLGNIIYDSGK